MQICNKNSRKNNNGVKGFCYGYTEVKEILLCGDKEHGETFLHRAALLGSAGIMYNIKKTLPRNLAQMLSLAETGDGRRAQHKDLEDWAYSFKWIDYAESSLKKDHSHQVGCYHTEFYTMLVPPKVLVFYSTTGRMPTLTRADGEPTDAETEKDHVLKYLNSRKMSFTTIEDPKAEDILSTITAALAYGQVSGLVVFIMLHGVKGYVKVKGDPSMLSVDDIISHMAAGTEGKPKVRLMNLILIRVFLLATSQ